MTHHDHHLHDAPSRTDPTGTTNIRRRYEAELVRRFKRVRSLIFEALVTNDVLGIGVNSVSARVFQSAFGDQAPAREAFGFQRSGRKVSAFMEWLRQEQAAEILGIIQGTPLSQAAETAWQNVYIDSAYQKGIRDAGERLRQGGATVRETWVNGAFNRPIHADRLGLIYTRAYSDLSGITDEMDKQISRVLAQGMAEGRGPQYIARQVASRVDAIGIVRARVLARTETIRAHAEATLNSYREAKVEGVRVMAEFTTAGDDSVCSECEALEGREYEIDKADGIIPVHPNCRCAWLPSVSAPEGIILE